jgi:hypothetical protein
LQLRTVATSLREVLNCSLQTLLTVAIGGGIETAFTTEITEITKSKPTKFFVCFVSFVVNEIILS